MNFLIAPNALKGSLTPIEAAESIVAALKETTHGDFICCPIADGGNGTLECLVHARSLPTESVRRTGGHADGKFFSAMVTGPLRSLKVTAQWGLLSDGMTAVIEMAEAAGLHLLKPSEYDVLHATTLGVGELINTVLDAGFRNIIIGLGGSATNDGGAGCARALGARFLDENGSEIPNGGIHLAKLTHIDCKNLDKRLNECNITALSDVTNVLYGPNGATLVFARQKGAKESDLQPLDNALQHYASILKNDLGKNVASLPGSGAAGGLGAGLIAFCHARIVSGIDFVLDTMRFDELLQHCDAVITAEGMIDDQTLFGKGISGIARRAEKRHKPVHAFVGKINGNAEELKRKLHLASLYQISPNNMMTEEAMRHARALLEGAIKKLFST
ncbi:MAG: glycerate kinase [Bacteroidota bacterium]|nr:glycerate kinase [Bacteroidota bacterium]